MIAGRCGNGATPGAVLSFDTATAKPTTLVEPSATVPTWRTNRAQSAIVAISEFTKSEVVELLGVPAEKVRVTPLGVGAPFGSAGPASDGDYVLAVKANPSFQRAA